jgi:hypothetical protein
MAYYPDLSTYTYCNSEESARALNVGWLSAAQPYLQGEVPAGFTERLWAFCRTRVNQTRGFHDCEFCSANSHTPRRGEETITIGSAEIRVFGSDGRVYAAPNLIYHYVVEHHYEPPEEFISAVLDGPLPQSPDYEALAGNYQWHESYKWWLNQLVKERLRERLKNSDGALAAIRVALPEVNSDDMATIIFHLGTATFDWRDEDTLRILTKLDKGTIDMLAQTTSDLIARGKTGSGNMVYRLKPKAIERLLQEGPPAR